MKRNNDQHAEYFEAILQLRPADEKVLTFVFELVKNRNDVKISKIKELKTGCDIYFTNQRFARGTLVTQFKKRFRNYKVVISKALYGQHKMTSKMLYRATILFRKDEKKDEE